MFINIADLMKIIAAICDEVPYVDTNPEKWALSSVDKSWSHHQQLTRFQPQHCWQLSYFRGDLEWNFLVSYTCEADEYFPGNNPWKNAKATAVITGTAITYLLTIMGEPLKSYQEQSA